MLTVPPTVRSRAASAHRMITQISTDLVLVIPPDLQIAPRLRGANFPVPIR